MQFKMLRTLALTLKVVGWLAFVVGGLLALGALFLPRLTAGYGLGLPQGSGWIGFLLILLLATLSALFLIAAGEQVQLFLLLEQHTRKIREALQRKRP